jgi:alpha-tubulin suppressor-like RCC1 family protein
MTVRIHSVALAAAWVVLSLEARTAQAAPTVIDVSVGRDGVCAIADDGGVYCWGGSRAFDIDGEISRAPHRMGDLKAKSVAAGGDHVCAVDKQGVVFCAGQDEVTSVARGAEQNLPDDSPDPGAVAWRRIPNVAKSTSVVSGAFHVCALTESKEAVCWGAENDNMTGTGKSDPHPVAGLGQVTRLSASERLTCALSTDKKVRCFGELGIGDNESAGQKLLTLPIPPATDVAAGDGFACGLAEDGLTATCVGSTERSIGKDSTGALAIKLPEKAAKLVGGAAALCAQTEAGKLWCTGEIAALLSRGDSIRWGQWEAYDTPAKTFAMYWSNVCGVTKDGALVCAGSMDHAVNELPRLQKAAVPVVSLGDVTDLTAGESHLCAKKSDGSVWCWGGTYQDSAVPHRVTQLSGIDVLTSGGERTCGQSGSGPLSCWWPGDWMNHEAGALGGGSFEKLRSYAVGASHACVVNGKGNVSCWGGDYSGALGYPVDGEHGKQVDTPKDIPSISGATAVAAGRNSACALLDSGGVRCWGANDKGQLGQGTQAKSGGTGDVVGLTNVQKLAVGGGLACALQKDGHAWCWGDDALTPVPWPGSDVVDVAAGSGNQSRACIVRATGQVECGLPGVAHVVRNVEKAKRVVAGEDFGCALIEGGTVRCWGKRDRGQLGDGRPPISTKLAPIALVAP